jgi:hypothetical protein
MKKMGSQYSCFVGKSNIYISVMSCHVTIDGRKVKKGVGVDPPTPTPTPGPLYACLPILRGFF